MPRFKFELESDLLGLIEIEEPVGWDSNKPTLSRSSTYSGIFRTFTVDLTFVMNGYDYVTEVYEAEGVLSVITIYIYEYDNSIHDYGEPEIGVLDLSTYDNTTTYGKGVKVAVTDSSFIEQIKNREDVEINYDSDETLDSVPMSSPTYVDTTLFGMEVTAKGTSELPGDFFDFTFGAVVQGGFSIPQIDSNGQIEGSQFVSRQYVFNFVGIQDAVSFFKAPRATELQISGSLVAEIRDAKTPNLPQFTAIYLAKYNDDSGDFEILKSWVSTGTGVYNITLDLSGIYNLIEGDLLRIYGRNGTESTTANTGYIDFKPVVLDLTVQDKEEPTTHQSAFIIDVLNRMVESMTGEVDAVSSSIFADGQELHDYTLQNGFLIRNYETSEAQMSFKFKDLYEDLDKIFNIGVSVNGNTLNFGKKEDFYQNGVVHSIGQNDVEAKSFSRTIDTDYFYSDIETGYSKSAYEEISGLQEYNNQSFFSTVLSIINNKLNLVTTLRGDGYGMEFARRLQKEDDQTEDSKWDDDNFILHVIEKRNSRDLEEYEQLTTEGFTDISGIDDITTPINLSITPARNLDAHSWLIATGLQKNTDSKIKFNKSLQAVELQTTYKSRTIKENESLDYEDLKSPIFTGHIIKFTAPLTLADFQKIKADPYRLIEVYDPNYEIMRYGWIKELSMELVDKSTNFELIEASQTVEELNYWLWNDEGRILWNDGGGILLNQQN